MRVTLEELFPQTLIQVGNKLAWTLKSSEDTEGGYSGGSEQDRAHGSAPSDYKPAWMHLEEKGSDPFRH